MTTTEPLTAQDVKALRTAETVVFRHYKGVATLEVSLRDGFGDEPRIYTASQQRMFPEPGVNERQRTLTVGGVINYYSEHDTQMAAEDDGSAFDMVHSAQYSRSWLTVANLLKAGDVLSLNFQGDRYTNGYVKKACLHADSVNLDVERGKTHMTFVVGVNICLANSARMVKPKGF